MNIIALTKGNSKIILQWGNMKTYTDILTIKVITYSCHDILAEIWITIDHIHIISEDFLLFYTIFTPAFAGVPKILKSPQRLK